ncbi:HNH endonuclease [Acinetobacter baumannii]|uniref:HNH endonuclease n=1 Tax=Acinetobacter baumannii TaxID=470 RepID=UPI00385B1EBF
MKYRIEPTYLFKSFTFNLEIYFTLKQKNIINILNNMSQYETLFNYLEYSKIEEFTYLYPLAENEKKTCIYCLKNTDNVKFDKKPHVISQLLGNRFLLHYEECDECNSHFGSTLETELDNFLKPYRTLNGVPNRNNKLVKTISINQKEEFKFNKVDNNFLITSQIENAQFDEKSKIFTLKVDLLKHRPSDVYKAFMKILYGLLPRNHLSNFERIRKWIINRDPEFQLYSPLNVIKTRLEGFQKFNLQILIFFKPSTNIEDFKKTTPSKENFEYLAMIMFGNIVFEIPLISDLCFSKLDYMKSINKEFNFTFPVLPKPTLPDKYELIDLSETKRITSKETLYFGYEKRTELDIADLNNH